MAPLRSESATAEGLARRLAGLRQLGLVTSDHGQFRDAELAGLLSKSVLHEDGPGSDLADFTSLHMSVVCEPGARQRSESEFRSLLEKAGFQQIEALRLNAPRHLVIARKP